MHHIRRKDREITDTETIEAILDNGRFATIALADGEQPYLVTLSYGYDTELRRLYFHAAKEGRKLDIIAVNPQACATVIEECGYNEGECEHPYRSVVMNGRMRAAADVAEAREAMRTLVGHLESCEAKDAIFERNGLARDESFERVRMLVFEIDSMTAKQGK